MFNWFNLAAAVVVIATAASAGADQAFPTGYGYPFKSRCCEAEPSCCQGLWDGFCGDGCCKRHRVLGWFDRCSTVCPLPAKSWHPCQLGCNMQWRPLHFLHRGCWASGRDASDCGTGCGTHQRCRLGLFDWLHIGLRRGCGLAGCTDGCACHGFAGGVTGGEVHSGELIDQPPAPAPQEQADPAPAPEKSARLRWLPENLKLFPVGVEF